VFSYRVEGRQKWESARTLDEARLARSARLTDIARGEFDPRSRLTLHEYAREWVERYQGRGRRGFREGTRDDYRRQLDQYVLRYFPARTRLTDVSPSKVAGFVGWLCDGREQAKAAHALAVRRAAEAGKEPPKPLPDEATRELSDATVRGIMAPLRACLGTAVREGLIRANPARDIDLPHRAAIADDDEDARALSREQLAVFLAVVPARHRVMFELLAATGLRISEAIGLEWRHLHLDGSTPHVKVRQAIVKGRLGAPKSRPGRRDVPIGS
jgi:integrase